jgi:hypothetical protein
MVSELASTRDLVERTELARDTSSLLYIRRTVATKLNKKNINLSFITCGAFSYI